ncbi:hypothetical protein DKT77_02350 [Meridianimarinicoccus roseus]|jgi:putative tricarboxylic transport membrane protein|uniref:DUF1468 domain-containing protein n=1 Tax=Meridianimarinicoccus roseus TaxID=2072018 RepID=A0A2V2LS17_9RHOB|nr:tripartite tricarboxylate transporter TctB family protein [Meridianimarinicoccus roseus]PWR04243.1 hypothetical protein DKT77_02350 [Meridianimarinicoccus roseus]
MSMALADRISAVVFFALGVALLIGGWTMERLEFRQIHPASIPGLVPMILGVLLAICAILLFITSRTADRDAPRLVFGSWTRLGLTALICTGYAAGLVGWLSYFWATLMFTFVFALVFSFPLHADRPAQAKALASAATLAICVAWGTALLFQEVFLVRLP